MTTGIAEGTKVGRYSLLTRLASGGMANVWLARVDGVGGFQKTVVVKTILPHLADDPEFVRMFIDEALLASQIQHPNVVNIFDLGESHGSYFIAMEYIAGRTLRHVQREVKRSHRAPPPWFVLRIVASACDGLHHAHTMVGDDGKPMPIVHRDVSPENVMVSFAGDTKVLDFGIAKASNMASKTRAGVLKGKHAYMAPEQIEGAIEGRAPHPRIDVYSAGVVLYELLTGRRPFRGANELALLRQILDTVPEPPHATCPWVPENLSALVMKAMARSPSERFQSALELRDAIETYLQASRSFPTRGHVANYLQGLFGDITTAPGLTERPSAVVGATTPTSSPSGAGWREASQADDPWQVSEELESPVTIDLSMVLFSDDEAPESQVGYPRAEGQAKPATPAPPRTDPGLRTVDKGWDETILTLDLDDIEPSAPSLARPAPPAPPKRQPKPPTMTVEPKQEAKAPAKPTPVEVELPRASTHGAKAKPTAPVPSVAAHPNPSKGKSTPPKPTVDVELPKASTRGSEPERPAPRETTRALVDVDMPKSSTSGMSGKVDPPSEKNQPVRVDIDLPKPTTRGKAHEAPARDVVAAPTAAKPAIDDMATPSGVHLWDLLTQRVRAEKLSETAEIETKAQEASPVTEPSEPTPAAHAWDVVVGRIRGSTDTEVTAVPSPTVDRNKKASDWFDEGLTHWRNKDLDATLVCWTKALEMDPGNRRYESNLRKLREQVSKRDKDR
jgi:serine/threonine-protein kinase